VQIDSADLAAFRAGMRRRYSDEEILSQLKASAERLGRSPTMREFEGDGLTRVHPQTVIERFGTWNAAKRLAGLRARRFATREELLDELRSLGAELGRPPTGGDLQRRRATMPSKSLYWHTFGSLRNALREAGFDVPLGEERLERAVEDGVRLSRRLRRLPRFADWAAARRRDPRLPSEWQVYRLAGGRRGAWATFQYLVRSRLVEEGSSVSEDGRVSARRRPSRARRGARGRTGAARGRARRGAALP
jgi:Homing endonuclease associated repeat